MKFMRGKEVTDMFGVNLSTIWRWRQKKGFPKPIRIGPNVVVWKISEIE